MKGYDVVVVGAGVIGLSAAYYLALSGRKVMVVERSFLGAGASGVNLGQLSVLDREPEIQLVWTKRSLALYRELAETEGVDSELFQTGGLLVFKTQEQQERGRELMERQTRRGVPVEYLSENEIKNVEPYFSNPLVRGALFCPWEGTVMPFRVLNGLAEAAGRRGAKISYHNPVTGFEMKNGRVKAVITEQGAIGADWVVLTAGSWTRELGETAGLDLQVYYHKGTALVSVPVPRYIRTVIVSGGFLTNRPVSGRIVGLGAAQHKNGSIIIGQATENSVDHDRSLSAEGVYETVRNFLDYFPGLDHLEMIRAWAGNTPYTPDGLPVYGFTEGVENLFVAAGLKGAFSTAPAAGQMAAGLIQEKEDSRRGLGLTGGRYIPQKQNAKQKERVDG